MDENPYKSPLESGYGVPTTREGQPRESSPPNLSTAPWAQDRLAVFAAATLAFFIVAAILFSFAWLL